MSGFRAWAPGRVNLIGEHTDYTGGLVCPMAIQLGTTITGSEIPGSVTATSRQLAGRVHFELPVVDPRTVEPAWGRYLAGVAALVEDPTGFEATVTSTIPLGAGLSSSAALEVAAALALGATGDPRSLATLCRDAEEAATGVPCGVMDQLASAAGVEGHALLLDCRSLEWRTVPVPGEVVVVHSGQPRALAGSAYAQRRQECEAAERAVGPLRDAGAEEVERIEDPTLRRRARHVVSENRRVSEFADALASGRLDAAGELMSASHRSLRDDFEVSTNALDALVERLWTTPGVHGARLTGAGFGGCVVALTEPGFEVPEGFTGWTVRPSGGAYRAVE